MSDSDHTVENGDPVLELIDAIKTARTPAKIRELGEQLAAAVVADRAGDEAASRPADPAS
jgi:hypothetical protein